MRRFIRYLILAALLATSGGCSRKVVYLPSETVKIERDTLRSVAQRVDSVVMRDSMAIAVRGDTVEITRWHERTRLRVMHDTIYKVRRDSVSVQSPYPVEVVKEIRKPLFLWQKLLIALGIASVAFIFLRLGKTGGKKLT